VWDKFTVNTDATFIVRSSGGGKKAGPEFGTMIVLDLGPGPGNKQLLIAGLPRAIDQCSNLIYGMRKAGVMGANGK
jgi:hypothetical protein